MSVAVNQGLRLAKGEHGEIVVTAAHCATCAREVLPRDDGTCSWCFTRIVDEDQLPAKELLAQLANGETTWSAEEVSGLEPQAEETAPHRGPSLDAVSAASSSPENGRRARRVVHDPTEIKAALLRFQEEHGREPTFADIRTCDYLPRSSAAVVWRNVAVELGWADPTAPKRTPRRRTSAASHSASSDVEKQEEPEVTAGSSNGRTPASDAGDGGSTPSPAAQLVAFTRDELWTLYDLALPHTKLRSKLRRAIEKAA